MKKFISLTLSIIMVFSLFIPTAATFCKDSAEVRIVVPEDWEMNIGDSRTIEAVFDSGVTDRVLTWTTSDESVAKVDKWGRVTAVGEGIATITATLSSGSFSKADINLSAHLLQI